MKNKKVLLAMLALALVFGMTVAGCNNGTTGGGGNSNNNDNDNNSTTSHLED
jgi:hypothetical protein